MSLPVASRGTIHETDKGWIWKFCFRVAATVFSLVGIGCVAWAVSANADLADTTQEAFWLLVWLLIPLGISVIWNTVNFIVLFARRKPIHPGANVGVDLILWIAFIVTGVIASFGVDQDIKFDGSFRYYYSYSQYPGTRSRELCPGFDSCDEAAGILKHRGDVEAAGLAFSLAAMVLHFTLFVAACIDVDRINKARRAQRAVTIAETIISQMEERGQLPWQQPSYQPAQHPTYHPLQQQVQQPMPTNINQPIHQPTRQIQQPMPIHTNQPIHQPTHQPQYQQVQRPVSPVSPEMTQVQAQHPANTVDAIEQHTPTHVPERSVNTSEGSSKGRNVLGLN